MTMTVTTPATLASDLETDPLGLVRDIAHGMQQSLRNAPETGGAAGPYTAAVALLFCVHLLARRAAVEIPAAPGAGPGDTTPPPSSSQEAREALDALPGFLGARVMQLGSEGVWSDGRRANPFEEDASVVELGITWARVIRQLGQEDGLSAQDGLLIGLLLLLDAVAEWQRHGDVHPAPADMIAWVQGLLQRFEADAEFCQALAKLGL